MFVQAIVGGRRVVEVKLCGENQMAAETGELQPSRKIQCRAGRGAMAGCAMGPLHHRAPQQGHVQALPTLFWPMFVVHCTTGSSYILSELDNSLSRLHFGTSCLLLYFPHNLKAVPVMSITDLSPTDLDAAMYDNMSAY